ncbi:MBL fold metallo-hydrolase [Streptomyces nodosus]
MSSTSGLAYAVRTATRQGLTRDLPHGPDDLQWVANTATLIYGDRDAVLVDTYTSIEQNAELVEWVTSFGRQLTHIFITHGHGDHFFGIGQLLEAFPEAKAIASKGTVAGAHTQGEPRWRDGFWEKLFPGQIPEITYPEPLDGGFFELEGHRLEVMEMGYTDTVDTTSLWVPDLGLVVAGDVAYNDTPSVHRRNHPGEPRALGSGCRTSRRARSRRRGRRTQEAEHARPPDDSGPDRRLSA